MTSAVGIIKLMVKHPDGTAERATLSRGPGVATFFGGRDMEAIADHLAQSAGTGIRHELHLPTLGDEQLAAVVPNMHGLDIVPLHEVDGVGNLSYPLINADHRVGAIQEWGGGNVIGLLHRDPDAARGWRLIPRPT